MIEVKNISKKYNITHQQGGYVALRDVLTNIAKSPFAFLKHKAKQAVGKAGKEEFWALKDINFTVEKGEAVGIIGANGAGKSTLLKILTGITPPTTGEIRMQGSVASLLEVGTGFHPELTGRENIMLNGAILGMKKSEIIKKFDAIVEFAGIEKFLDTPVKYYSSGMYVRLAFSVAAHMEPDILIVDEVLAVGDAEFQKKCLGKMGEITQKEGRTILFVSHNMGAIRSLCSRTILLSEGKIVKDSHTDEVINYYMKDISQKRNPVIFEENPDKPINILEVAIGKKGGENSLNFDIADEIEVTIKYKVREDIKGTNLAMHIDRDGSQIFWTLDIDSNSDLLEMRKAGEYMATVVIPKRLLRMGVYSVTVDAGFFGIEVIVKHDDCLFLEIENKFENLTKNSASIGGMIMVPINWKINRK
ncbi:ABC transporter ATP-binding protein [Patescibacteria group bacterium]|nr:ABC transporter ATP-binding protein [Patescibacteria group bacterium]